MVESTHITSPTYHVDLAKDIHYILSYAIDQSITNKVYVSIDPTSYIATVGKIDIIS